MGALTGRSASFPSISHPPSYTPLHARLLHRMILESLDSEAYPRNVETGAKCTQEETGNHHDIWEERPTKAYRSSAGAWAAETRSAGAMHLPMPSCRKGFG